MITPVSALDDGLVRAVLEIVRPSVPDPVVPLRFNPSEYQLQKANTFAEIAIPGLESPPIQFIRGASETLSTEVLVDTSDTLEDVRGKYVEKLRNLLRVDSELHAPPIVRFVWDTEIFVGVLESLGVTYTLFSPEGVPWRASLAITLKEYRSAAAQVKEMKTASPDFDKRYTVQRGDSLSGIAGAVYGDPGQWRAIARANDIQDPRSLPVGATLRLPRLR